MIIAHQKKFIFVAIPKTGTHAIRTYLRPYLHKFDWEQCILLEKKQFPIRPLAALEHGHLSLNQVIPFFPNRILRNYFKFCFVRNPLDRFISCFFFYFQNDKEIFQNPICRMKQLFQEKTLIENHFLFKPQYEFIFNKEGEILVDYVGKFETFIVDFAYICKQIDIVNHTIPFVNKTKNKSVVFDKELIDLIQDFYIKDYNLLNYQIFS